MDNWRVAVLGDGGVGKTALAVQVSPPNLLSVHPEGDLYEVYPQLFRW
jgi:predicted ATPase